MRRYGALFVASLVVLGVYVAALEIFPKAVFWHPDEGAKFIALQTIRWDGGLRYDVPYRGRVNDPAFNFYPGQCGYGVIYPSPEPSGAVRFYWPIWFPLLSRPFFDAFGAAGLYVIPVLSGWLIAVLAGIWAAAHEPRLGAPATLVAGLATPIAFQSMSFSEHTLATLCGAVAVTALVLVPAERVWRLAVAAFFLLAACVLRIEMLGFVAAVVCAAAVCAAEARLHRPSGAVSSLSAPRTLGWRHLSTIAIGLLALAAFSLAVAAAGRARQLLSNIPHRLEENLQKLPFLIEGIVRVYFGLADFSSPVVVQAWILAAFGAVVAGVAAPLASTRRRETLLIGYALLVLLESSLVATFAHEPYMARQGILVAAPYLIVIGYAFRDAWGRGDQRLLRLASIGVCYAVIGGMAVFASKINASGEYLIGLDGSARYALTLYPIGVVVSLVTLQQYRRSDRNAIVRSAFAALVLAMVFISAAYEYRGLRMVYANRTSLQQWQHVLEAEERVVTNVWWLAGSLAPFYTAHEFYCVRADAVHLWVAAAAERGLGTFVFASTQPIDVGRFLPWAKPVETKPHEEISGLYLTRFALVGAPSPSPDR